MGHIISAHGVKAYLTKIEAILDWPKPISITALRAFLGLSGYYRPFFRHYASLATPLTDLLRFETLTWSTVTNAAFSALKAAMTSLPILRLPNFELTFDLESGASTIAIGAVLSQEKNMIAFFTKKLSERMLRASAYVREMHAITVTVKKWRQYLWGRFFRIYTNQKSLKHLDC